ncbi:MAG: hypothetical protein HOQ33_15960, partial [Cupriavidus sp.]|nr:hypothetical protein [Cupriavidus sp.]
LLTSGNDEIANAFCRARLARECGFTYGTLDPQAPVARLIDRASLMI